MAFVTYKVWEDDVLQLNIRHLSEFEFKLQS